MTWKTEELKKLRGYAIEWAEPNRFILSRRNELFETTDLTNPLKKIATVTAPSWKVLAANFRLAQRLLRFMTTNVLPLAGGDLFVTFDKSVGVVRGGKFEVLKALHRPCRVLRAACAIDSRGDVYFGEYLDNVERGEMRVYRYRQGADALETAYVFPANSIRHIHGIYFDRFSGALFCLTGDAEKECSIFKTVDGFQTLETVGSGDETWRAVSLLFTGNSFYYGTDAEFRINNIFHVNRENLERENLGEVDGTIFYSRQCGDDMFFATTAENAPSQRENVASIWHVGADKKLNKLVTYEKDGWHGTLFMFGTIHFANTNAAARELFYHLVGLKGDNRTFRLFNA